jgi:hypothetical protein
MHPAKVVPGTHGLAGRPRPGYAVGGLLLLVLGGCQRTADITVTRVPKPDAVWQANHVGEKKDAAVASMQAERILGAIIHRGDALWFFKVQAESSAATRVLQPLIQLVKDLSFADDRPVWKLPEGWSEKPGNEFRYATLVSTEGTELSVSRLPFLSEPLEAQLLSNVNRWRGQLQLPPVDAEGLKAESVSFELGDEKLPVTFVNLEGTSAGGGRGGMMSPPFAGGAGRAPAVAPGAGNPPGPRAEGGGAADFNYTTPEGWKVGAGNAITKLLLTVADGSRQLKVTVTDLPAAANDLTANVNRWRGQVGLSDATADAIRAAATKQPTLGVEATEVVLTGPDGAKPEAQRTIHGLIAVTGETMWFVKLDGPADLAARERDKFLAFAKSLTTK